METKRSFSLITGKAGYEAFEKAIRCYVYEEELKNSKDFSDKEKTKLDKLLHSDDIEIFRLAASIIDSKSKYGRRYNH